MAVKEYTSDSIQVLDDIEHIKLRRQMYIGEHTQDARQLLSEMIDNALDEVQSGYSDKIVVTVDNNNSEYTVRDFGRGIPHGLKTLDDGTKKETIAVLLSKANSGGKFDNSAYIVSSGLHGVGLTVTNALSDEIEIISYRDGKFVLGVANGTTDVNITYGESKEPDGTFVRFIPNKEYFNTTKISNKYIIDRCRVASALGFRAELYIDGKEVDTNAEMHDLIHEDEPAKVSTYVNSPVFEVKSSVGEIMKVALRYTSETNDRYFGYTNLLSNYLGGTHVQELSKTLTQAWIEFIDKHKNIKPSVELRPNDYLVGLRAVCAVFISHPEFSSQTKEKLVVPRKYFTELMELFKKSFNKFLEENIVTAQQLIKRFEEYRIAQNQLLSRKEISSLIKINNDDSDNIRRRSIVSKLVDCTSKSRKGTELFLCLTGDTPVKLLNGEEVPISSLVGSTDVWAYSVNEKGQFVPTRIKKAFKTRDVNKLCEIKFSDGSVVKCTPEHRFLDRDTMCWVEAQNITVGQSMFSVKTKLIDGYTNVWVPAEYTNKYSVNRVKQGRWELLHRLVATQLEMVSAYDGKIKYNVHHKDFVRTNNDPSNLEVLTFSEHFRLHALKNIEDGVCKSGFDNMSEESRQRRRNGIYKRTPEGIERQKRACKLSWEKDRHNPKRTWAHYNGSKKFWEDLERNKEKRIEASRQWWRSLTPEQYAQEIEKNRIGTMKRKRIQCIHMGQQLLEQGHDLTSENWKKYVWKNGFPSLEKAITYFGSISQFKEEIENYNLKVVSIEFINTSEYVPVYCLEVDNPFHAFVLGNGIVTHNCEGNSARGPFLFTRNVSTQAVLALRGKILNITGKSVKEAVKNAEICDIANSIGCGIGPSCDASKSRYEKVIISADADPDGLQITCLVLSVFVNMFPDMIKQGRVYIAEPPLYCWGDNPKNYGWCNKVEDVPKGITATRFKGLGEMENSQLEYFLVNPKTRNIKKVQYPSDVDEFNKILGSSTGKRELLQQLGIIEEGR